MNNTSPPPPPPAQNNSTTMAAEHSGRVLLVTLSLLKNVSSNGDDGSTGERVLYLNNAGTLLVRGGVLLVSWENWCAARRDSRAGSTWQSIVALPLISRCSRRAARLPRCLTKAAAACACITAEG